MKARDLAALAALGIAGKYAYDKFGNKKDDEPKTKGELGKSKSANDSDAGESEARMDNYSNEGRNAKFANEDYSNEGLGKTAPDYSNEGRGKVKKEKEYPLFPRPVAKKETVVKPVVKRDKEDFSNEGRNSKRPTVVTMPTGDDRFVSPEEGAKAYVPRRTPGAADGVGPTSSSTAEGMAAYVPRRTVPDYSNEGRGSRAPVNATSSSTAEGMAAYVPRRPGQTTPQATSSSNAEGMAGYVPRRTTTASDNAQAQARMMRQGSPLATARRNAGMPGYDEAGNPIAMRSMAGQRGFDEAGNPMKRGGVVKMASGGMTSSRMSKPSGASRGDGIAQRGRTRGKYL